MTLLYHDGTRSVELVIHQRGKPGQQYVAARRSGVTFTCYWFDGCLNLATTTAKDPILGDTPICDRCKNRLTATP